jgi:integrase
MATANLTKRTVDALKFTPGCDYFVWDSTLRGFGVRVTQRESPTGKLHTRKVFVVGYRSNQTRQYRRLTIGTFGPLTVDQARTEALRHLSEITRGTDPLDVRRAAAAERTVRELGPEYLADVRIRRKTSTAHEYTRLWNKHVVPAFGSRKVAEVSPLHVTRLHRSMHETPYVANRVAAMLGAFFSFAAKHGARPAGNNPAHAVEWFPEKARERFLSAAEFRRLGTALATAEREGLPPAPQHRRKSKSESTRKHVPKKASTPIPANPYAVAAIRLLTLTGCRENEILSLRWDAVDFDRGFLRLTDTKTGKSERRLGQSAAALLANLPRLADNPHVLPGAAPGSHLKEIKRVWYAVRHAAALDSVRLHDLRHSYASVSATGGEPLLVIRSLLGHARIATTERYAHLSDDPVKRAADRASSDIAAWLDGEETPVRPLRIG